MPNCFSLTKKGEQTPTALIKIDEEICRLLDQPVNPQLYADWYQTIGFCLAMGSDWDRMRELFHASPDLLKCIDYLEANYIPDAWARVGK